MVIVVLTGSIAMGKSTAGTMLRRRKIPVFDADEAVHNLLKKGGMAVDLIKKHFPTTINEGAVDRSILGKIVFGDPQRLSFLESLVHPLVDKERRRFLQRHQRQKTNIVVLDIPLFFETKKRYKCDVVCVVSAPRFLQKQRALARSGMTREKLNAILSRQLPDHVKRKRADFVVPTGLGKSYTNRILIKKLKNMKG
jgi:dephospho-CoA kinase